MAWNYLQKYILRLLKSTRAAKWIGGGALDGRQIFAVCACVRARTCVWNNACDSRASSDAMIHTADRTCSLLPYDWRRRVAHTGAGRGPYECARTVSRENAERVRGILIYWVFAGERPCENRIDDRREKRPFPPPRSAANGRAKTDFEIATKPIRAPVLGCDRETIRGVSVRRRRGLFAYRRVYVFTVFVLFRRSTTLPVGRGRGRHARVSTIPRVTHRWTAGWRRTNRSRTSGGGCAAATAGGRGGPRRARTGPPSPERHARPCAVRGPGAGDRTTNVAAAVCSVPGNSPSTRRRWRRPASGGRRPRPCVGGGGGGGRVWRRGKKKKNSAGPGEIRRNDGAVGGKFFRNVKRPCGIRRGEQYERRKENFQKKKINNSAARVPVECATATVAAATTTCRSIGFAGRCRGPPWRRGTAVSTKNDQLRWPPDSGGHLSLIAGGPGGVRKGGPDRAAPHPGAATRGFSTRPPDGWPMAATCCLGGRTATSAAAAAATTIQTPGACALPRNNWFLPPVEHASAHARTHVLRMLYTDASPVRPCVFACCFFGFDGEKIGVTHTGGIPSLDFARSDWGWCGVYAVA